MTNKFIDELEEYLSNLDNVINQNTKNSLEKVNIITKIEELVFWLEQYRSLYLEDNNE